jgi:hypothetical protein
MKKEIWAHDFFFWLILGFDAICFAFGGYRFI